MNVAPTEKAPGPSSPPDSAAFLGIDLGGTNIKAVWADAQGNALKRQARATGDSVNASTWKEHIRAMSEKGAALEIGIAAPGLASADGRSISYMPGRLHGLEGLDWAQFLGREVHVLNDAHAALLGEARHGAARGKSHVVMLTLGTGVGGAVLVDGRLLRGAIGRAGHLGHISLNPSGKPDITGMPGSLEDAVGECTVRERTGFASTRELAHAAREGNPHARRCWHETMRVLAAGIASLINAFDPELVVLGGGITAAGDMLFMPLEQFLEEMEWRPAGRRVPLVPAELAEWAGAIGAATHAKESQ